MSVKTCQLCGKPLGRIRGSDGDFCSKEHRNQYRLRRGLNRLEEADKVATLMRRRENLRPIPASELQVAGTCEPRPSDESLPFPAPPLEPQFAPLKPALFQARVPQTEGRYSKPLSDFSQRSGSTPSRLLTPASQPFVARRPETLLDSKKSTKPPAGVVRAGLTSILSHAPATTGATREFGAVLQVLRRPASPRWQVEPVTAGAASLEKARQLQAVALEAVGSPAREVRSHGGREFARRSLLAPASPRGMRLQFGLPEPRPQSALRAETQDVLAVPRMRDIPRSLGVPCFPRLHTTVAVSGAQGCGVLPMPPVVYEPAVVQDRRAGAINWDTAGPVILPVRRERAFQPGLAGTGHPIPLRAYCDAARDHRAAGVSFGSTEQPFELAPMELHGAFPASGSESGRSELDVIEEHFDSGLEQWTGDIVEWKRDAAGVRPAGLALFRPSISLSDYEFEFFTRIEARAVTYAFRAANVSNYFKITIAMVESGRYELRRCAVIGGIDEPAATGPLPGVLRPGAAFTVRTRAAQNDFTVWLDGELAARWTDGRMPTGGVGFLAPRDDRARVYWVRVSPIENPNSPAAAHRPVRSIQ